MLNLINFFPRTIIIHGTVSQEEELMTILLSVGSQYHRDIHWTIAEERTQLLLIISLVLTGFWTILFPTDLEALMQIRLCQAIYADHCWLIKKKSFITSLQTCSKKNFAKFSNKFPWWDFFSDAAGYNFATGGLFLR